MNFKIKSHKIFCLLLLFALIFGMQILPNSLKATASADSSKTLKVAFPIVEGMSYIDDDGSHKGLVVDFLNEIANYTGWKYEYILVSDPMQLNNEFKAGKFDLMGGAYYIPPTSEEAKYYGYPDYNTGYSKSALLARWDDDTLKSYDISTLSGKKIGVYERALNNIDRLKKFISMNSLDCEIVPYGYDDYSADGNLYHKLSSGEVDMLLGNFSEAGKEFRAVVTYDAQPYYIVCKPDATDVLQQLNFALERIYESNANFAEEVYLANFSNLINMNVMFTEEERNFIANNTVKIAVPFNVHPLFCATEQNENWHNGILYDLMDLIGKRTGLKYEYVQALNFADSITKVKAGEADVVGFFLDSITSAAEREIALTKAYASINMTLVKNRRVTYPSDNLTVAIVDGREVPVEINAQIKVYQDVSSALKAANSGEVDLFYGIASLIEKEIQDQYFSNLVSVSIRESVASLRFAVKRPANTPIFTILNKSIGMLSDDELATIINANSGALGKGYSFKHFVYANPLQFAAIIAAVLILASLIIVVTLRFKIRSARMETALEKSYADNRAKSDFLSRMSHEIRTPMNAITGLTDIVLMRDEIPESSRITLQKIRASSHYLLALLNDILDMSRLDNGMVSIVKEPYSLSRLLDEINSMMSGEAHRKGIDFKITKDSTKDWVEGDAIRLKQVLTNLISNAIKFTNESGEVDVLVQDQPDDYVLFSVKDTGCGIEKDDRERIFNTFEQAGDSVSKSNGTGLGLSISKSIVKLMGGDIALTSDVGKGSEFKFSIKLINTEGREKNLPDESKDFLGEMEILIAEDNDLNAEIAQDIIEMAGASVTRAVNGKQAVDEFEKEPDKYDAILMDIQMPVLNGLEATKRIRASSIERGASIPIIAMTANSFQEDSDAAMAAGMNHFIAKPIDTNLLYTVLKEIKNSKK